MKKIAFMVLLLGFCAVAGRAQESRQDISLSGTGTITPYMSGTTDVLVSANRAFGALLSYRFMLTPSSALEVNYGIDYQHSFHYIISNTNNYLVSNRMQEISGAYVRYFVFKNFNPFLEAGPAALIFVPIYNSGTKTLDAKQQTSVGAVWGGGIAYEISPSFDFRVEFRSFVAKVPTFGDSALVTNRWYKIGIYEPVAGIAYHF